MKINKTAIGLITFIFLIAFFVLKNKESVFILETTPKNNDINVIESSDIFLVFNENIKEKSKKDIEIKITPSIEFESVWIANTFKIIPKQEMENNTIYSIAVLFKNKDIYTFKFETLLFKAEDILKYGPSQTENDLKFAEATVENIKKHPWYTSIPIEDERYTIFYDFDRQIFRVTFLTPISEDVSIEELSDEIELKLKSIGVENPNNFYFIFD